MCALEYVPEWLISELIFIIFIATTNWSFATIFPPLPNICKIWSQSLVSNQKNRIQIAANEHTLGNMTKPRKIAVQINDRASDRNAIHLVGRMFLIKSVSF